jgi:hypothetical protein
VATQKFREFGFSKANMKVGSKGDMEQKTSMGTFRVKYKETGMYSGPSSITNYLGTLRKGATLDILDDTDSYYYMVRADSGDVGYVYRDAGEVVGGISASRRFGPSLLSLSKDSTYSSNGSGATAYSNGSSNGASNWTVAPAETSAPSTSNGNGNGLISARTAARSVRQPAARPPGPRPATPRTTQNGMGVMISSANRATGRVANKVAIISGEIAVFDKPGIVGTQVGKLRRGEQVALVAQDDYFYCVTLPNGNAGYIPRYAAETV